jgi:protease-4
MNGRLVRSVVVGLVGASLLSVAAGGTAALGAPLATRADDKQSATSTMSVGLIELDGAFADRAKGLGFGGAPTSVTFRDLIKGVRRAGKDEQMKALVLRMKDASLSMAHIEELGAELQKLRDAGKKVHLYAEGYGNGEMALASYCDEVILQSGGEVMLPGIYMEEMFLADTFKWLGITPDFVQVGDYKGASEMMANAKPSPQWEQNINGLLDGMYANLRQKITGGRKMSPQQLDAAMEKAWMASGEQAKAAGLVDSIVDLPDLSDHIAKGAGAGEVEWDDGLLPDPKKAMEDAAANPFTIFAQLMKKPDHKPKRDSIAVLHIDGAIVDGESTDGGLMGGDGSVGSRTIRRALGEIEDSDKIKGVVIRIDSPGGSAIASEMIWQGVQRIAKTKPVWVSIGGMAASGGYYIAVSGQKIYVNPSSIVGSIGVVGGKMALGGAMEKLHVNVVPRARGPRAAMFGSQTPWSEAERGFVRQKMTETYELFARRVSAGRPGIELAKTAEGRLFVGNKAIELKMADKIGGLSVAIDDLAGELSLAEGKYDVLDYPAPKTLAEVLEDAFGGFGANARVPRVAGPVGEIAMIAREVLGADRYAQVVDNLNAIMQLRSEPVILAMPRAIIFK